MSTNSEADSAGRIPAVPDTHVPRPRLLDQLDDATQRPLTCVTGWAGTGKSVLVAHWSRARCSAPVLWLDMLPDADDPQARMGQLSAALAQLTGNPGLADTDWLCTDRSRLGESGTERLAAALAGAPESVLVLDGIRSSGPVDLYADVSAAVARSQGCGVHLIAVGRCIPPAEVMPLQLRGRAVLIDSVDLELDAAELAAVVAAYGGGSLDEQVAHDLAKRLEGWMVGAVIVGLSSRNAHRESAVDDLFDAAFEGMDAYITTEILGMVSEDTRRFLRLTACTDDVPPGLCDAITDRHDSDNRLAKLRAVGLPIKRQTSRAGTFRYLAPLREVLDLHLSRQDPEGRTAALRAAAKWYSDERRPFESAACWARLGEWNEVINVIFLHLQQILDSDDLGRLAELVTKAPPAVLREQVSLALSGAWVLRMDGRVSAAIELLAVYERYMDPVDRMIADVERSGTVSWVEDVHGSVGFAEAALAACAAVDHDAFERRPPMRPMFTKPTIETFAVLTRSHALLAGAYGGEWARVQQHLVDVTPDVMSVLPQFQIAQVRGGRATFLALAGRAADAFDEANAGLSVAASAQVLDHRATADAYYGLAEAQRLMVHRAEALDALDRSEPLAERNGRKNLLATIAASRAQLLVDAGESEQALRLLHDHRGVVLHRPPKTVAGLLASAEARALAATGNLRRGMRVLDLVPATSATATTRVAIAVAIGDLAAAREAVAQWPAEPTMDAVVRRSLAAAAVADAMRDSTTATTLFVSALGAAADHRLVQPFIEYGRLIGRLLQRVHTRNVGPVELELARRVQSLILEGSIAAIAPRFTPQEGVIVSYLADGLQLRDIAAQVHISVNTVKAHVKAIYRKLGVNNRADAVRSWTALFPPET